MQQRILQTKNSFVWLILMSLWLCCSSNFDTSDDENKQINMLQHSPFCLTQSKYQCVNDAKCVAADDAL